MEASIIIRSFILSSIMGICCRIYYGTVAEKRNWKPWWIKHMDIPAFMLGFLIIAVTEIPPYILQPVRLIAVIWIGAQVFYKIKPMANLVLSTLFCAVGWLVTAVVISVIYTFSAGGKTLIAVEEEITIAILLGLLLFLHYKYRQQRNILIETRWIRFGYFPFLSLTVIVALTAISWEESGAAKEALLAIMAGFSLINIAVLYIIGDILQKDARIRNMQVLQEHTQNQMSMYRDMLRSYGQQKQYLHDYKNQLGCIQGMAAEGKQEELLRYIEGLTGSIRKSMDYVNTNHTVVNVILNQKYRYAQEKGIMMTLAVNDLSELTMKEEDVVILLVNLIDNAIEACEKLKENKVIWFKMMLEEEELILSIRNPVEKEASVKHKRIATSKRDREKHGIGLINIDEVIKRNNGTSVLGYEGGCFYYSAMIPSPDKGAALSCAK